MNIRKDWKTLDKTLLILFVCPVASLIISTKSVVVVIFFLSKNNYFISYLFALGSSP